MQATSEWVLSLCKLAQITPETNDTKLMLNWAAGCGLWTLPCACCAGGVGKVQRFEDVLQQCACERDRGRVAVLQTGRKLVIHKNI